jgi:hypothetical protein
MSKEPDIRLLIGIPSQGSMCADTALSLALLASDLCFPLKGKSHVYNILNVKSSILPQGRQSIVDAAIEGNATHLLFIDSDMTFPPFLARKLLASGKDVIGANCPTRGFPCNPTARDEDTKPVYSNGKTGLEKVWRLGTGILMITVDVLKALPRPCFTPYWHTERDAYVGEDWAFIDAIENAGFSLWVDHDVSQQIGHIGSYIYTHDDIEAPEPSILLPERAIVRTR